MGIVMSAVREGKSWLTASILFMVISTSAAARPLVIGSLSEKADAELSLFLPVAQYLAAGLGQFGIDSAEVRVCRTHAEMAALMSSAEVDLFIDSSMSAMAVQQLSGGGLLARRWKKGIAEYSSVIFTRADSRLHELADLGGESIAFEAPFSSSGFLLPAHEMHHAGLTLTPSDAPQLPHSVAYLFSKADENTLLWVLHGRTSAGAMAEYKYAQLSAPIAQELRVIFHTVTIPYHVVIHRPQLPEMIRAALHDRLLAMDKSGEGRLVLNNFEKTTRFDDIPEEIQLWLRTINLDLITGTN